MIRFALLFFCWTIAAAVPRLCAQQASGIVYFKALREGDDARLEWQLSDDKLLRDFIVERATEGLNFEAVGVVMADGPTLGYNTYAFLDEKVIRHGSGQLHYRLLQLDNRGASHVLAETRLSLLEMRGLILDVTPDPAREGFLIVAYQAQGEGELYLQIKNSRGQSMLYTRLPVGKGFLIRPVAAGHYPPGAYNFQLFDDRYAVSKEVLLPMKGR